MQTTYFPIMVVPAPPDLKQQDAWSETARLAELCRRNLPGGHPIQFAFNIALHGAADQSQPPDDFVPTMPSLSRALAAFDALDEELKRRALGGWHPDRPKCSTWELAKNLVDFTEDRPCPVLQVEGGSSGVSAFVAVAGQAENALRLTIREGTTRAEAVQTLQVMLDLIEAGWEQLPGIASGWSDDAFETSVPSAAKRPPEPLEARNLDGVGIDAAISTEAA